MPWNGNGVPVRETPVATGSSAWVDSVALGDTIITDTDHDFHDQDIANMLANTYTLDGQTTATADFPMGTHKFTNVGAATARTQFARVAEVQDSTILSSTASGTDTYTAVFVPAITGAVDNQRLSVRFTNANATTTPSLDYGAGAKTIVGPDGSALCVGDIAATGNTILSYSTALGKLLLLNPANRVGLIQSGSPSTAASIVILNIPTTVPQLKFLFRGNLGGGKPVLTVSVDNGANWLSSNYSLEGLRETAGTVTAISLTAQASIALSSTMNLGTPARLEMNIATCAGTSDITYFSIVLDAAVGAVSGLTRLLGQNTTTTAVNAITITPGSGTITGSWQLWSFP